MSTTQNKEYPLSGNTFFKALKTTHRIPSQGYTIFERVKKLLPEFLNLSGNEIVEQKNKGTNLTEDKETPLVSFSGDTQMNNQEGSKEKLISGE